MNAYLCEWNGFEFWKNNDILCIDLYLLLETIYNFYFHQLTAYIFVIWRTHTNEKNESFVSTKITSLLGFIILFVADVIVVFLLLSSSPLSLSLSFLPFCLFLTNCELIANVCYYNNDESKTNEKQITTRVRI